VQTITSIAEQNKLLLKYAQWAGVWQPGLQWCGAKLKLKTTEGLQKRVTRTLIVTLLERT